MSVKHVVAGIIVSSAGEILICQRRPDQALPLKWEFPGGKIEDGEEPEQALHRELEEELGIRAVIGPEVTRTEHTYKNGNTVALQFFRVDTFHGALENRIFEDLKWVRPAELVNYDFLDADVVIVRDLAKGKFGTSRIAARKWASA